MGITIKHELNAYFESYYWVLSEIFSQHYDEFRVDHAVEI